MTDLTGFGLAGHLLEMMEGAGLPATLNLSDVPLLPGALAASSQGHASSLAPANRAAAGLMLFTESPKAALLFDPQTAGGLLAAIPEDKVADTLRALVAAGDIAAVIGRFGKGPVLLTVTG
jgi:selenide,water dikinase